MFKRAKILVLISAGVVFFFKSYVIVVGQVKPVLAVLNKAEGTLTMIDPVEMKITGKAPTGDSPHEVVLSSDGKTAYVANYGSQTPGSSLSIIDTSSAKELKRVDLKPLYRPHGLQLLDGKLYFTSEVNRLIARYDPVADKVDWMMGSGQNATHMITASPDQRRFYTSNIGSDTVSAFEFQNVPPANSRVTHIAVGKQPEAIDLSPDGKEVWAGLNVDGMIDIVDTTALRSKEKINIGGRPYRVKFAPDGRTVACSMIAAKEILLLDAVSRKETKRIKLSSTPLGIAFSADGKFIFVSAVEPDVVLKIRLDSGEVTGRVESGRSPDGIAVTGL